MVFTNCKVCDEEFEAEDKRTKMCPTCSRQKQLDRCKAYKQKNKERVKEYNKVYKEEHKDEVDAYNRVYNLEHREESKNDKPELIVNADTMIQHSNFFII